MIVDMPLTKFIHHLENSKTFIQIQKSSNHINLMGDLFE
jgi:hypothetical protein